MTKFYTLALCGLIALMSFKNESFIKTEPCPKEFSSKSFAGDWKVKRDSDGNRVV